MSEQARTAPGEGSLGGPPEAVDLLVVGIGELATPQGRLPRAGGAMGQVATRRGVAVACDGGRFVAIGEGGEIRARFSGREVVDAGGGLAIPGLVDAHTHPVFLGTREGEFEQRIGGLSYVEIWQ